MLKNVAIGPSPGKSGEAYLYVEQLRPKSRVDGSFSSILAETADLGAAPFITTRKQVEGARRRWKALWFDEIAVL